MLVRDTAYCRLEFGEHVAAAAAVVDAWTMDVDGLQSALVNCS